MAAACLVLALLWGGGTAADAHAADKVVLQLQWVHQAQFAGYYLAQDAGLYRRAGLMVTIRPAGPGINSLQELAAGRADFATAWLSGALEMRARGIPLVHLAQLIQRSALLLVSLADRGVSRLQDLNHRRVGLWGGHFSLAPRALFARQHIQVEEVLQNVSMTPLIKGAVAAASAMRYNEYHQLYQAGIDWDDIVVMDFADMGLNFPEDGIYTLRSTWRKNPDLCRRLVQASLAGWRLALQDPQAALAAVMKRVDAARLASNRAHQRWMLGTMRKLITYRVGPQGLGRLAPADFALVLRVLREQDIVHQPVALEGFAVDAWRGER